MRHLHSSARACAWAFAVSALWALAAPAAQAAVDVRNTSCNLHSDYALDVEPSRLLLSQDSGWYWVGQQNGGEVRNFNYLSDVFLPALHNSGINEATIRKLMVENPANAFAI